MSSRKGFRTGSNSYGQFWFGGSTFPGFLYKKNVGVGARRSTQFTPGGTTICNQPGEFWNKYKPGNGGVGASSVATRRAKMRLATICDDQGKCGDFYKYLGLFDNYTGNGLKAAYPFLNREEWLQIVYLLRLGVPYEAAIAIILIGNPELIQNYLFLTNSNFVPKGGSANIIHNLSSPDTYLDNWYRGGAPPSTMTLVYDGFNYGDWLYSNKRPPNNSNIIAFQNNNNTTSAGVYLYQTISGTVYKNAQYKLTFYATNRGGSHYQSDPNILYLYFKINDQIILTNYNPASNQAEGLPWKFVSISFTWTQNTIANPTFTFGQVSTISGADVTIFITQPRLKLDIPI